MSVTITITELAASLRLSDSLEEIAEATRLLDYATAAVIKHVPTAPDAVHNESVRRLAGYLYDMPEAARGDAYANALRNSGAARMLLPYRIHRAGYSDAVAVAQAAVGSVGNPVVDVSVNGAELVVTFADGSIENLTLLAGVDNAVVQALIDAHAAMTDIHHRPSSRVGVVTLAGARLPASDGVTMRIGWSNTQDYSEDVFTRDGNHPDDGAAGGTIAGVFPPVQPAGIPDIPDVAVNEKYLHIWVGEIPGNIVQLTFFGAPAHGVSDPVAQTYNTTDGTWWVSNLPLSAGISAYAFSAIAAGLLIATQQWVTAEIANIMLSGGGITTAQAQTLIDAAIVNFQTETEIEAIVTTAINALTLGQTPAQVQALIEAHAAMANIHHTPGAGGGATISRYVIPFPASSYSYLTAFQLGGAIGEITLTSALPSGSTLAGLTAGFKTAVLQHDFQSNLDFGVTLNEYDATTLWGTHISGAFERYYVNISATGFALKIPSDTALDTDARDGWSLHLSVVS